MFIINIKIIYFNICIICPNFVSNKLNMGRILKLSYHIKKEIGNGLWLNENSWRIAGILLILSIWISSCLIYNLFVIESLLSLFVILCTSGLDLANKKVRYKKLKININQYHGNFEKCRVIKREFYSK